MTFLFGERNFFSQARRQADRSIGETEGQSGQSVRIGWMEWISIIDGWMDGLID